MYVVYNYTEGDARSYLYPRYQRAASDCFKTADEMFDYLRTVYIDPYHQQAVKREYQELQMISGQTFYQFCTTF